MVDTIPVFDNDEQRRDSIIRSLQELKESYGWKIILNSMEVDITDIEAKLHGEIDKLNGETHESLQERRNDRIGLRDIVDNLIAQYGDAVEFPPDLDPYN